MTKKHDRNRRAQASKISTGDHQALIPYSQETQSIIDSVLESLKRSESGIILIGGANETGKTSTLVALQKWFEGGERGYKGTATDSRKTIGMYAGDVLCLPVSVYAHIADGTIVEGLLRALEEQTIRVEGTKKRRPRMQLKTGLRDQFQALLGVLHRPIQAVVFLIDELQLPGWNLLRLLSEIEGLKAAITEFDVPVLVVATYVESAWALRLEDLGARVKLFHLSPFEKARTQGALLRSVYAHLQEGPWEPLNEDILASLTEEQSLARSLSIVDLEPLSNLASHLRRNNKAIPPALMGVGWRIVLEDLRTREIEPWLNSLKSAEPLLLPEGSPGEFATIFSALAQLSKCSSLRELGETEIDPKIIFGGFSSREKLISSFREMIASIRKFSVSASMDNLWTVRYAIDEVKSLLDELNESSNEYVGSLKVVVLVLNRIVARWDLFCDEEGKKQTLPRVELENRFEDIRAIIERIHFDVSLQQSIRMSFDMLSKLLDFHEGLFVRMQKNADAKLQIGSIYLFDQRSHTVEPLKGLVIDAVEIGVVSEKVEPYGYIDSRVHSNIITQIRKAFRQDESRDKEILVERTLVDNEVFGVILAPIIYDQAEEDPVPHNEEMVLACALIELVFAYSGRSLKIDGMRNIMADLAHKLKGPTASLVYTFEQIRDYVNENNLEEEVLLTKKGKAIAKETSNFPIARYTYRGVLEDLQAIIRQLNDAGQAIFLYGEVKLNPRNFPLREAIEEAQQLSRSATVFPVVEIVGARDAVMNGDYEKIVDVFANLISNSIKNAKENHDCRIVISIIDDYRSLRVGFRDNGLGIHKEHQDNIWNPHWTTDIRRGSGLGLAIVRRYVELHGGDVALNREYDDGAEFVLTLPKGVQDGNN